MQGVYVPTLETVLAMQPQWHDDPQLEAAWEAAARAGLDVEKAREQMVSSEVTEILNQDAADTKAVKIERTPTFYVNGKLLQDLGHQQLYELVRSEVEQVDR
jgi:protein-disulfide isomerase